MRSWQLVPGEAAVSCLCCCAAAQAKVLRTLQYFPLPEGTLAQRQLHDTLVAIFNREWAISIKLQLANIVQYGLVVGLCWHWRLLLCCSCMTRWWTSSTVSPSLHTQRNASNRAAQIIGWLLLLFAAAAPCAAHTLPPCSPCARQTCICTEVRVVTRGIAVQRRRLTSGCAASRMAYTAQSLAASVHATLVVSPLCCTVPHLLICMFAHPLSCLLQCAARSPRAPPSTRATRSTPSCLRPSRSSWRLTAAGTCWPPASTAWAASSASRCGSSAMKCRPGFVSVVLRHVVVHQRPQPGAEYQRQGAAPAQGPQQGIRGRSNADQGVWLLCCIALSATSVNSLGRFLSVKVRQRRGPRGGSAAE
jgi:hypothetical protein